MVCGLPDADRQRYIDKFNSLGTGAVQRGREGTGGAPPIKILPLSCAPPMKFMIKHNLPLVRGGSI